MMNQYQGANDQRKCFSAIFNALCLLLLLCGSNTAFAVGAGQTCQTTSIIASTPTTAFTANGNGTVTHVKTGLMWKRCSEGLIWNGTTCSGAMSVMGSGLVSRILSAWKSVARLDIWAFFSEEMRETTPCI